MYPFPSALLTVPNGPVITDPYFANVKLLLGYTGTTGSTTITDESPAAHTPNLVGGDAAITNATTKFGSTLGLSGSGYVNYADHADWTFGSGDFTVETWFRFLGTATKAVITKWNGSTQHEWGIFVKPALIEFYWSTTGADQPSVNYNPGFTVGSFYHIAFSRVGNTGHLCFDGLIVATANLTGVTLFNGTAKLAIGANNEGSSANLIGHLDETRITKGVGRYSGSVGSSYTLPTAAFPRS